MNLGPLNRRAVLYRNDHTLGEGGAPQDNLVRLRDLPVTVGDATAISSSTVTAVERDSQKHEGLWTTRWIPNLDDKQEYRLTFEGRTYRVLRWREVGRRHGLVITGEAVV